MNNYLKFPLIIKNNFNDFFEIINQFQNHKNYESEGNA